MKYSFETDPERINKAEWDKFVGAHPNGNIFHTPEMVELYESNDNLEPLVIACYDEAKRIVGVLVAVNQKEYSGLLGKLTARAIVWGGPLVLEDNAEIASLILTEFDKLCHTKTIFSQFRNLWDTHPIESGFAGQKYSYEEHLDFHFDLQKGKEALWSAIHPTRRKQINRGMKRGVQTRLIDAHPGKELTACFAILKQVYREAELPHPDITYFENAIRILGSNGYFKMVLAIFNDEIIGFRYFLCYQGLLYDWYAGSDSAHYDKYPNDILPWEILKWGAENGYKLFDFGGAGKPGVPYGVRDYKLKFGGNLVNFGRFEKVHKPVLMAIAKNAFTLWKLFRH